MGAGLPEPSAPVWDPSMSDGCSVPRTVARLFPAVAHAMVACRGVCVAHDEKYERGGTAAERLRADIFLFEAVCVCADEETAVEWFNAVRLWGSTHWGRGPWYTSMRQDDELVGRQAP